MTINLAVQVYSMMQLYRLMKLKFIIIKLWRMLHNQLEHFVNISDGVVEIAHVVG